MQDYSEVTSTMPARIARLSDELSRKRWDKALHIAYDNRIKAEERAKTLVEVHAFFDDDGITSRLLTAQDFRNRFLK